VYQDHQSVQIVLLEHFLLKLSRNVPPVRMDITLQLVVELVLCADLESLHHKVLKSAHLVQLEATVSLDLDTHVMRGNTLKMGQLNVLDVQLVSIILLVLRTGVLGQSPRNVVIVLQVFFVQLELKQSVLKENSLMPQMLPLKLHVLPVLVVYLPPEVTQTNKPIALLMLQQKDIYTHQVLNRNVLLEKNPMLIDKIVILVKLENFPMQEQLTVSSVLKEHTPPA